MEVMEVQEHGVGIILALLEGSDPETRPDELASLRGSGANAVLLAIAQAHPTATELVASTERGMAQLSDGMMGYVYHSLVANMSSWRLWGGNAEPTAAL